jgi:hypothetical protein
MYTNINSSQGIQAITDWLEDYKKKISTTFLIDFFLQTLKIVMTHNVLQLDDTFWLQTCGTLMGTSCACAYATLYWGYIERKHILPKWKEKIIFLRWFIGDKLGIWVGTPEDFNQFIDDINSYSQLKWETTGLNNTTNFLDLTISINSNGTITTKTYQKPTNLHLYIPPNSAHPPGILKSIIYGNLQRYWLQNTNIIDFMEITKQFAEYLITRGYNKEKITNLFHEAARKLDGTKKIKRTDEDTIYLHWTWHPRDLGQSKLQVIFNETLKEKCGFNNLIIAYSRPKNLRDCLIKAKLSEPEGFRVSTLLHRSCN